MTDITVVQTPVIVEVSPQVYTINVSSVGIQGAQSVVGVTAPITYDSTNHIVGINSATTSQSGAVQLSDSTSTTDSTKAATSTAVKSVNDAKANLIGGNTLTGTQVVQTANDANVGLKISRNSATQTADLVQVTMSDGTTVLAKIDKSGNATVVGLTTSGTITTPLTTGLVHSNSGGVLSSSLLVNADITNSTIDLTAKVTGLLPSTNGGTGASNTTPTGTGANVLDSNPTIDRLNVSNQLYRQVAAAPAAVTTSISASNILSGWVTSGPSTAQNSALPANTSLNSVWLGGDTALLEWSYINTGTANATLTAGTNHTPATGNNMVIAAGTSARFATRRSSGGGAYITYRLA